MPKRREANPDVDVIAERLLSRVRGALALNLRERRAASGKTQERVAEEISVSVIYLQGLERGRSENPTLRVLALLAHALGCTPAELLAEAAPPRRRRAGSPSS